MKQEVTVIKDDQPFEDYGPMDLQVLVDDRVIGMGVHVGAVGAVNVQ